jgi:hypothetical protein
MEELVSKVNTLRDHDGKTDYSTKCPQWDFNHSPLVQMTSSFVNQLCPDAAGFGLFTHSFCSILIYVEYISLLSI